MRSFHVAALSFSLVLAACSKQAEDKEPAEPAQKAAAAAPSEEGVTVDAAKLAVFAKLPAHFGEAAPEPVWRLGQKLYHEARLSKNHDVSCNSCHDLEGFGVDGEATSAGHKGQRGERNSPTVFNAAGHVAQFWDGRAKDVEEQALGPILNPVEMALASEEQALEVLRSMPEYVEAFEAAFPGEGSLSWENVGKAIGAFERKLATPSSFDRFLAGETEALDDAEKRGLNTFVEVGCTACHNGALLGGGGFQRLGMVKPWPELSDKGRAAVTENDADLHLFKVPSLRNVAKTGPYFHDGTEASLDKAVSLMATHQLGRELKPAQVDDIVAFLNALTGEVSAELARKPELPPSTDKTPKPDPS